MIQRLLGVGLATPLTFGAGQKKKRTKKLAPEQDAAVDGFLRLLMQSDQTDGGVERMDGCDDGASSPDSSTPVEGEASTKSAHFTDIRDLLYTAFKVTQDNVMGFIKAIQTTVQTILDRSMVFTANLNEPVGFFKTTMKAKGFELDPSWIWPGRTRPNDPWPPMTGAHRSILEYKLMEEAVGFMYLSKQARFKDALNPFSAASNNTAANAADGSTTPQPPATTASNSGIEIRTAS